YPSFIYRSAAHRDLHSFPTRRSSDLRPPEPRPRSYRSSGPAPSPGRRSTATRRAPPTRSPSRRDALRTAQRRGYGGERFEVRRRSEEHTSELQSPYDLVCRLLLEKKK